MIRYVNGRLHIIDQNNRFGDPTDIIVGELLASVLEAAEVCLTTDNTYLPDAINLIRLASLLVPSQEQYQTMGDAIDLDDLEEELPEDDDEAHLSGRENDSDS